MIRNACILACLLVCPAIGQDAPAPADQLASMTWLAGSWKGAMWGGTFHAYYSTPQGGKILSTSELRRGDKVAFYEFEIFEVQGGTVVLRPHPGGKRAAMFKLTATGKNKATFENPGNDFPKKLVYHRAADDSLVITLSGNGKVETFDLKRSAACGG